MAASDLIGRAARPIRSAVQPHRAAPTAFRHVMVHDADGERRSALPRGSSPYHSSEHNRPAPGSYGLPLLAVSRSVCRRVPGYERRRGYLSVKY